ncbi:MAG: hypothetical protein ABSG91_15260 [Syntrophobacteraceae bacterium]|jgi:hypothetical protein
MKSRNLAFAVFVCFAVCLFAGTFPALGQYGQPGSRVSSDPNAIHGTGAGEIDALTGKTTPADADETMIEDSAQSLVKKKLTWANLKAALKTYFDGIYTLANLGGVAATTNVKTYMGGYEQAVTETGEAATCNWGNGSSCYVTMEANTTAWTLTMSNPVGGQVYRVVLKQPASNGPCPLPTFSPTVTWAGGSAPTLTATAGKRDVITCYYSTATTEYMCDIDKNF